MADTLALVAGDALLAGALAHMWLRPASAVGRTSFVLTIVAAAIGVHLLVYGVVSRL